MKEKLNWGLLSKYRAELYGISALMIMVFHCINMLPLANISLAVIKHLNYGVDIFLLLSGISLYFAYKPSSGLSQQSIFADFVSKRFRRILVPYFTVMFFSGYGVIYFTILIF